MKMSLGSGVTLAEMLLTLAIVAIIGSIVLPTLQSADPQKLGVAVEETANALRFALGEAKRTGGYVLIDGKSTVGQLKFFYSTANGEAPPVAGTSAMNDPITKRPAILNGSGNSFWTGVSLTPQFRAGGSARPQLLIGPGVTQMQGFDGTSSPIGSLQANSGVLLAVGSQSALVKVDPITGLVTLP